MGLWLWRGGGGPRERSVTLQLGGRGAVQVRALEAQFADAEGQVEQRAQRFFRAPPPPEVELKVHLSAGPHTVLLFLKDAAGEPFPTQRVGLDVGDSDAYALPITVPARPSSGR